MDISILIPSRRTEHINQVLDYYHSFLPSDLKYELAVYSKEKPTVTKNLVWVEETEECNGAVRGFNELFKHTTGKCVYVANDDVLLPQNLLHGRDFLESSYFANRRFKVTTLESPDRGFDYHTRTQMPIAGGLCAYYERLPSQLRDERFLQPQHRYTVFWYVVALRATVEKELNGYIFNPKFLHHYCDNYISFFIGEKGEFPLVCPNTNTVPTPWGSTFQHNHDADWQTFCELAVALIENKDLPYA